MAGPVPAKLLNDRGEPFASIESGRLVLRPGAFDATARAPWLDLAGLADLVELPDGLRASTLDLRGCARLRRLPEGLRARHIILEGCVGLESVPPGLACETLNLRKTSIRSIPAGLQVSHRLDLADCRGLTSLPDGLRVGIFGLKTPTPTGGALILRGCDALEWLPNGLDACHVDVRLCARLRGWREGSRGRVRVLLARGCPKVESLPGWLDLHCLDVTDCPKLRALGEGMRVSSRLEVANTGLAALPDSLRDAPLRWRGVQIPPRYAFEPETITAPEVLAEGNAELRRVMMERMGLERFLAEARAEVLDVDRDAGGERRLLRVAIPGDEPLVCVLVRCPSTGQVYILRVPPEMRTCRQAVAWTAGFDDPDDYAPRVET